MDKPKLYKKIKRGTRKKLNRKTCKEWHDNHLRNPLTNRVIKLDGPVYKKLKKNCEEMKERLLEIIGLDLHI